MEQDRKPPLRMVFKDYVLEVVIPDIRRREEIGAKRSRNKRHRGGKVLTAKKN
jgi:hypothetical protein